MLHQVQAQLQQQEKCMQAHEQRAQLRVRHLGQGRARPDHRRACNAVVKVAARPAIYTTMGVQSPTPLWDQFSTCGRRKCTHTSTPSLLKALSTLRQHHTETLASYVKRSSWSQLSSEGCPRMYKQTSPC
jgi:hypothetical protein